MQKQQVPATSMAAKPVPARSVPKQNTQELVRRFSEKDLGGNTHERVVKNPGASTTVYNGVCLVKRKDMTKSTYEGKFSRHRLGTYKLATDAALAYDSMIRAIGSSEHHPKINFRHQNEYLRARKEEMKAKGISIDLDDSLHRLTERVEQAAAKEYKSKPKSKFKSIPKSPIVTEEAKKAPAQLLKPKPSVRIAKKPTVTAQRVVQTVAHVPTLNKPNIASGQVVVQKPKRGRPRKTVPAQQLKPKPSVRIAKKPTVTAQRVVQTVAHVPTLNKPTIASGQVVVQKPKRGRPSTRAQVVLHNPMPKENARRKVCTKQARAGQLCRAENCFKYSQKGGLCWSHFNQQLLSCTGCNQSKSLTEFAKDQRKKENARCKGCAKQANTTIATKVVGQVGLAKKAATEPVVLKQMQMPALVTETVVKTAAEMVKAKRKRRPAKVEYAAVEVPEVQKRKRGRKRSRN